MKFLFINYEFPPLGGGGGRANAHIAEELVNQGHEVCVMTSRFAGEANSEVWRGVKIVRIPTLRRHKEKCSVIEMIIFLIMSLIYSVLIYRRERPQTVVSFFSLPCGPAGLLLNFLFGVPYMIGLLGGDVPGHSPDQLGFYHKLTAGITRLMWRRAAAVTSNSQGLAELAQNFAPDIHFDVIPNGVDKAFFFKRAPITTVADRPLKLLTVGRLTEYSKRVARQIAIVGRLKRKGVAVTLTIVGHGPDREMLETQAAREGVLNTEVFFKGWCERENIYSYYRDADVFLLTSDYEGMANVLLEAMAASLAIVATPAPGTVDLVQNDDNGYLVPATQLEDFDARLIQIKNTPGLLTRFQTRSYEKASGYTWHAAASAYVQLAEKITK